jgi:hypothetical protein
MHSICGRESIEDHVLRVMAKMEVDHPYVSILTPPRFLPRVAEPYRRSRTSRSRTPNVFLGSATNRRSQVRLSDPRYWRRSHVPIETLIAQQIPLSLNHLSIQVDRRSTLQSITLFFCVLESDLGNGRMSHRIVTTAGRQLFVEDRIRERARACPVLTNENSKRKTIQGLLLSRVLPAR